MAWLVALVILLAVLWLLVIWGRRSPQPPQGATPPVGWYPETYDLDNAAHVALMDAIRQRYADALRDPSGEFAELAYKPASLLPHPKQEIRKALTALLDYARDQRSSRYLHPRIRRPAVIDTLEASLLQLDTFLDIPAADIPREATANVAFGFRHARGGPNAAG